VPGRATAQRLPSDEVLERLRDGDEAAFALVLDTWSDGLVGLGGMGSSGALARALVSTHDSAAEVVQETWLAAVAGIARFEGRRR
jgi:RNA polymerase sigma-70 factor, ECF subfamily